MNYYNWQIPRLNWSRQKRFYYTCNNVLERNVWLPCPQMMPRRLYTDICIRLKSMVPPTTRCALQESSGKTNAPCRWTLVLNRNNQVHWRQKSNGKKTPKIKTIGRHYQFSSEKYMTWKIRNLLYKCIFYRRLII